MNPWGCVGPPWHPKIPFSKPVSLDAALGAEIPQDLGEGAALIRSFLWSLLGFSPHLEGVIVCHSREC